MYNELNSIYNMPNFLEYMKLIKFINPSFMFKNIIVKNKGEKYRLTVGSGAHYVRAVYNHHWNNSEPFNVNLTAANLREVNFTMSGLYGINLEDDANFTWSGSGSSFACNFVIGERGCTILEWLKGTSDPSKATASNVFWYFIFSLG